MTEDFSSRAENQAEALAVERHQERKHAARLSERDRATIKPEREASESPASAGTDGAARNPSGDMLASRSESPADPKPPPRYIDPEVFAIFHSIGRECLSCGYWRASAHHLVSRAQGGDDVMENLLGLCGACHGALHDGNAYHAYGTTHTPEGVRNRIGAFLTSEAGEDHLNYVKTKLGPGAAVFLSRYGVED